LLCVAGNKTVIYPCASHLRPRVTTSHIGHGRGLGCSVRFIGQMTVAGQPCHQRTPSCSPRAATNGQCVQGCKKWRICLVWDSSTGIDMTIISIRYRRLADNNFLAFMRAHNNLLRRSHRGMEGICRQWWTVSSKGNQPGTRMRRWKTTKKK
jgi:hypothetical protein